MTARIAVLVSGTGRSLENLAERARDGRLDVEIALVVSDRPGIEALERAERFEIPALVLPWREAGGSDAWARRAFAAIEEAGCELVVLAGFLRLLALPPRWRGRVLNVHPALLPAFGGQGYYGMRVHQAVLASGARESGCTVHFVDDRYDTGPIVLQHRIPVEPGQTAHELAARVFEEEKEALPEAVRRVLAGEAQMEEARG